MRKILLTLTVLLLAVPGIGKAQFDPVGCGASMTRVSGLVQDMVGSPLVNIQMQIFSGTNSAGIPSTVLTNAAGRYTMCLSSLTTFGLVYRVQASDPLRKFESKAEQFQVTSGITAVADVDFTLAYRLTLNLSRENISNASPTNLDVFVRSGAPDAFTTIHLEAGLLGNFILTGPVAEGGSSPFLVYKKTISIPPTLSPGVYNFKGYGTLGVSRWTAIDQRSLVVDQQAPAIYPDKNGSFGVGVPDPNNGGLRHTSTTNPQPTVLVAISDALSGVDKQSVLLWVDGTPYSPTVTGPPSILTVSFTPSAPLPLGPHTFQYQAKDFAGNVDVKSFTLTIVICCGQAPTITSPAPGGIHLGTNAIPPPVIGFGAANTYPTIAVNISDPDGLYDIAPGSIRVRLYYGDVQKAHYDPTQIQPGPDPADPNTGSWTQSTGRFDLKYNYLNNRSLPGIYTVVAEVSDHGGNTATLTWYFYFVAAA